jgi:RimJ/RimL family protein N-acetyltransferase
MASLQLVAIDACVLAAFRESPAALESRVGASLGPAADAVRQALEQTAAFLAARPCDPAWGCFLAVDEAGGQVVGTCAYKGGPAADGSVEVAYRTFPPFEGLGYATGMAAALAARAGPRRVLAHTLPERNASCRVLEKAGFIWAGEVIDAEDGLVWRWVADAEPVAAADGGGMQAFPGS